MDNKNAEHYSPKQGTSVCILGIFFVLTPASEFQTLSGSPKKKYWLSTPSSPENEV